MAIIAPQSARTTERTFAWLGRNRRSSKDDERQPGSSEAVISIARSQVILRRLEPQHA